MSTIALFDIFKPLINDIILSPYPNHLKPEFLGILNPKTGPATRYVNLTIHV